MRKNKGGSTIRETLATIKKCNVILGYFLVKKNVFGENWGRSDRELVGGGLDLAWLQGCAWRGGRHSLAMQAGVWGQTVTLSVLY